MHGRWRSVGSGATRRPLHAHRHATRARNIRAAPASVLDRSAAPPAAEDAPQQGQGRQAGAPAGRRGGWRTANGVLHYTGDDASEPGSQAQLSGSSVAARGQAEGAAAAACGTSLAAPVRSDRGWALVRWEDPTALAGAGGNGTPRSPPDSAAGASDSARAQEPARAQGQSGGGSKKRRARRTWLQQPTRAATVTWVVGDGGAVPQEAGVQAAGADPGFRVEGSAQPAAAGEAASTEGRAGVSAWGATGREPGLAGAGAVGDAAGVLAAAAPGAAGPGAPPGQAAHAPCAEPGVQAARADALAATALGAAPEPAPASQARGDGAALGSGVEVSTVVEDLLALQRAALEARRAAAAACASASLLCGVRPRPLCDEAKRGARDADKRARKARAAFETVRPTDDERVL